MKIKSLSFLLVLVYMAGCHEADTKTAEHAAADTLSKTHALSFIHPPLPAANVPYVNYTFDAAKGDTLVYKTGSILLFPANAFVDEAGRVVTGEVEVRYREFRNPVDMYLAGIPMNYDSAGQSYQFVSAGMFEMLAYKNNKSVFVNPAAKPLVNLASKKEKQAYNIYYLDTIKKNWIYKEVSAVVEVNRSRVGNRKLVEVVTVSEVVTMSEPVPMPPVKPKKPGGNSPVIEIEVAEGAFEELQAYNNLKFQLDEKEQHFDAGDANEVWTNVKLEQRRENDLYVVQFSNARKTVTYLVKPVFEGLDYDAAMKVFDQKQKQYEQLKQQRFNRLVEQRAALIKDSIANAKMIEKENKRIDQMNRVTEANNKVVAQQQKQYELLVQQRMEKLAKQRADFVKDSLAKVKMAEDKKDRVAGLNRLIEAKSKEIEELGAAEKDMAFSYRAVQVGQMGYWNCDAYPIEERIYLMAKYVDKNGKPLLLNDVVVFSKGVDGVAPLVKEGALALISSRENAIIGIINGGIAFINYDDVKDLNITRETKGQTFTMTVLAQPECTYEKIQTMVAAPAVKR